MLNPEFDYEKLFTTHRFLAHEKLLRWVSLDQKINEKTFYDVRFINCNWLNTQFSHSRFLNCSFNDLTINHSVFNHCYFENVTFDQWTIRNTRFENCVFISCHFKQNEDSNEHFHEMIDLISFRYSYLNRCSLGNLPKLLEDNHCLDAFQECILIQTPIPGPMGDSAFILTETPKQEAPVQTSSPPLAQSTPPVATPPRKAPEPEGSLRAFGPMNRFNQIEIESKEK